MSSFVYCEHDILDHLATGAVNEGDLFKVCGLKWSPDNTCLASGGNDNRLYVWNMHSLSPIQTYTEHLAAVKGNNGTPIYFGNLLHGHLTSMVSWQVEAEPLIVVYVSGTHLLDKRCNALIQDHKCATLPGLNILQSL
uniref:Uncharacterized protein n=1 Tax=Timema poppense TaxID=170557 RepID=A0A7R9H2T7_TIMPO|nr:unnamed protein product [Timema poppensis]